MTSAELGQETDLTHLCLRNVLLWYFALMWLSLYCWAREYYISSCSSHYEQGTNMVPLYKVCLLPVSKKLGTLRPSSPWKTSGSASAHTYICSSSCTYTGSTRWCILSVYYRQVSQARRRTFKKDTVNWCTVVLGRVGSNPGCMQGESEDLRIVRVTQRAQQSLLPTDCFPAAMDWIAECLCLSCLQMHRANKTISEICCVRCSTIKKHFSSLFCVHP